MLKLLYNFFGMYIIYKYDSGPQVGDEWDNLFTLFYECFVLGLGVYEFTGYVILNSIWYLQFLNYIVYILYKTCLVSCCISLQEVSIINQVQWSRNFEP